MIKQLAEPVLNDISACAACRYALSAGVAVNLDNLQELERTAGLIAEQPELLQPPAGQQQQLIGLRINPQVRPESFRVVCY